jgi:ABC-type branched-subunit amino acid transport system ATPase component
MLEIKDLVGGYGSVQILNGATLKVDRGQIVALLGGNGTGKSDAAQGHLRIAQALERLDHIRWYVGSMGSGPTRSCGLGLVQVTQGKEAFPGMTVEEKPEARRLRGGRSDEDRQRARTRLQLFPDPEGKSARSSPARCPAASCRWCVSGAASCRAPR